jgi:hypothetical protein
VPAILAPDDVITAAAVAEQALWPVAERDWSVRVGPLDWDVERTITHMIGAAAKYTLYLASRSDHFIALYLARWLDATNAELLSSIAPVAAGLAAVAGGTPPQVRAYHADGPTGPAGFLGKACVEFLVHTDDALAGFGLPFSPPAQLCGRVLAQQYPDSSPAGRPPAELWPCLLRACGRPVR